MPSSTARSSANPSWFIAAVQTLTFLARTGSVCSSVMIADYVHSHATFLRRVVAQLVRAGLVLAHEGRDGGYCLASPADQITLADIYLAVKPTGSGLLLPLDTSRRPLLEGDLRTLLAQVVDETEQEVLAVLRRYTIADLAARTMPPDHNTTPEKPS